jgi:hypothetical protein
MTQYQSNTTPQTPPAKPTVPDPQVGSLKEQLAFQQKEIDALKRTVRKLQNEVRLAVNTFNLTNRG